jgi:hypothetical protein
VLFSALIICFYVYFFQISDKVSDFDKLKRNKRASLAHLQIFKITLNLNSSEQSKYINVTRRFLKTKQILGTTLLSVTDTLMNTILVPSIYISPGTERIF